MGYDRNPMNDSAAYAAEKERRRADTDAGDQEPRGAAATEFAAPRERGDKEPHRGWAILGWIRRAVGR